ncbi:MAG: LamG domain-containing protein [Steroidobacteraceae bacterium]
MTHNISPRVARLAGTALLLVLGLAGCGGGAETAQNPLTSAPTQPASYTGPTPATADIQAFKISVWDNVKADNRCGSCHKLGGQTPDFARMDDVNLAYQQALGVVNLASPADSRIVTKVASGHNCWLADNASCGAILTRWISDWASVTQSGGGKTIQLTAPPLKDPGSSKSFPVSPPAEFAAIHNLLKANCAGCHSSQSATQQQPFFASSDVAEAYAAAKVKINLDNPALSRFVVRLRSEFHNCWAPPATSSPDCAANANVMQAAIQAMSNAIAPTQVDSTLFLSKALSMYDGTVASGGNRYDTNVIALYEFKTGSGNIAYDTSGVEPALNLTMSGADTSWVGGWGIQILSGKAQGSTAASKKLHDLIGATGEYSIEGWVVPANVTQEQAHIISYSGGTTARNFTLGQTMYNYDAFGRSSTTNANGSPALSTADADEDLQAALQHVVVTFNPVSGRKIYVNGVFTGDSESSGGTLGAWDDTFAFVLGNEVSGNRQWQGTFRLVAIHNRALTPAQVQQNFEAGVGQKYFLLFSVSHLVNVPQSYVMFEVSQYDSHAYLFNTPKFISLDPAARPGSIAIRGMRIGLNGAEPTVGQAYKSLDTTITDSLYTATAGQAISNVGTIIGLEKGPQFDEFYLCFDQLGSHSKVCSTDAQAVAPAVANVPRPSDIGVRTFEEIAATMASITGVSPNVTAIRNTYANVKQQLPNTENFGGFLAAHQVGLAQLAISYCSALVDDDTKRGQFWGVPEVLNADLSTQGGLDRLINPLLDRTMGLTQLASNPDRATVKSELESLVSTRLCSSGCNATRTRVVTKAVCAAAIGNAVTLVQ